MRNAKLILLLLLIIAFIPYLYTCFYALPFADDFCFGWTASAKIAFTQKFLNQYLHWNGRYTSDVLVNLHPITTGSLLLYQLVSFLSVIATPVVFFVFIRQWVQENLLATIVALFITLFYLCYVPNITEGVYWYIGLVNYHWGSLCTILQLAALTCILKHDNGRMFLFIPSVLLLIAAIGFNEIGAALIPAYYLCLVIYFRVITSQSISTKKLRMLLAHFAVAVIASAFVICSPGNFTRTNEFAGKFNILHSLAFAVLQTIRFTAHWAASIPFVVLSLVVLANAHAIKSEALAKIKWGVWFGLMLFTVFMAAFIPYMATGVLGQHRTINYVFPFFILLWLGTLLSLAAKYRLAERLTPQTGSRGILIATTAALLVISLSGNERKILTDMQSGIFPIYREEFLERQLMELNEPTDPISPLGSVPVSFQIVDAKKDSTWWVDKCMKHFYTETDIILN